MVFVFVMKTEEIFLFLSGGNQNKVIVKLPFPLDPLSFEMEGAYLSLNFRSVNCCIWCG